MQFLALTPVNEATHILKMSDTPLHWSDPANWVDQNGHPAGVPGHGAKVVIPAGAHVLYDADETDVIHTIRIDGAFTVDATQDTTLHVDYIAVASGASFVAGTQDAPIPDHITARIVFADVDPSTPGIDTDWDPHQFSRGLVAGPNSHVSIHGADKTDHATLAGNHAAGSDALLIEGGAPADWAVGDVIVLAGTDYDRRGSNDDNSKFQDEVLEITAIEGDRISFVNRDTGGTTLRYDHSAPEGFGLDIHVANLSRNVTFESVHGAYTATQDRGHIMIMDHDARIVNAGLIGLGRSDKNRLVDDPEFDANGDLIDGTGTNPRGRYALHFHQALLRDDPGQAHVEGSVVWGGPGWGFVNHTSRVHFESNVSFDVVGAHFVNEDGNEQSTFIDNIAIKATGNVDGPTPNLLTGQGPRHDEHDLAVQGYGFWYETANSNVRSEGNIAVSTAYAGFLVYGFDDANRLETTPSTNIPEGLESLVNDDGEFDAKKAPLHNFIDNTAYNTDTGLSLRGVTRDDDGANYRNGHLIQSEVLGFTSYAQRSQGIEVNYSANIRIEDALIVGDPSADYAHRTASDDYEPLIGIQLNKNARNIDLVDPRIFHVELGVDVQQTLGQGYDAEAPFAAGSLTGGEFGGNTWNFIPAAGRVGGASNDTSLRNFHTDEFAPFSTYFDYRGGAVFHDAPDPLGVVAEFETARTDGSIAYFDASASFDPDYPAVWDEAEDGPLHAGGNTIVAFGWDFDGDGVQDAFGRYAAFDFGAPGVHDVTLSVLDASGDTASVTRSVEITDTARGNLLLNGDFSDPELFTHHYRLTQDDAFEGVGWKSGRRLQLDDGQVRTQDKGERTMAQAVFDNGLHKGPIDLAFTFANVGDGGHFEVRVYGANGPFTTGLGPWADPQTNGFLGEGADPAIDLLFSTGDVAVGNFEERPFVFEDIDFGEGYEFIIVTISTDGAGSGADQRFDNIFLGDVEAWEIAAAAPTDPEPEPEPEPEPAPVGAAPLNVFLAFTDTDETITPLLGGEIVSLADIEGRPITIFAEAADGAPAVGSVRLSAPGVDDQLENAAPYALFGDAGGDFRTGVPIGAGDYAVTLTAYSGANGTGEVIGVTTLVFTVEETVDAPPADLAPVVADQSFTTPEDTGFFEFDIFASAVGFDPEGEDIFFDAVTGAENGSATLAGAGSILVYTPNPDFNGTETLTVTLSERTAQGANRTTATFTIEVTPVNDAPAPADDTALTGEGRAVVIDVLANDEDVDGDALTIASAEGAANGTLAVNADGTVTYTPNDGFAGEDVFTYAVSDGRGGTARAHVLVSVAADEDAPEPAETVATYALYDTATDEFLAFVADGDVVPYDLVAGRSLTVIAAPQADLGGVDSVRLTFEGRTQTENAAPYALFGDRSGDFLGGEAFASGEVVTIETAYFSGRNGGGDLLAEDVLTFTIGEEPAQASLSLALDDAFLL